VTGAGGLTPWPGPGYSCGTVPDSHRLPPFGLVLPGNGAPQSATIQLSTVYHPCSKMSRKAYNHGRVQHLGLQGGGVSHINRPCLHPALRLPGHRPATTSEDSHRLQAGTTTISAFLSVTCAMPRDRPSQKPQQNLADHSILRFMDSVPCRRVPAASHTTRRRSGWRGTRMPALRPPV
jgi:hypothetical protein